MKYIYIKSIIDNCCAQGNFVLVVSEDGQLKQIPESEVLKFGTLIEIPEKYIPFKE